MTHFRYFTHHFRTVNEMFKVDKGVRKRNEHGGYLTGQLQLPSDIGEKNYSVIISLVPAQISAPSEQNHKATVVSRIHPYMLRMRVPDYKSNKTNRDTVSTMQQYSFNH